MESFKRIIAVIVESDHQETKNKIRHFHLGSWNLEMVEFSNDAVVMVMVDIWRRWGFFVFVKIKMFVWIFKESFVSRQGVTITI